MEMLLDMEPVTAVGDSCAGIWKASQLDWVVKIMLVVLLSVI
jgi:hypothetical protein